MNTSPVPRSEVVKSYCRIGTAEEIAFCLNLHYRTTDLTAKKVETVWAQEYDTNIVLRELGERPAKGFLPSEKMVVAEKLLEAA